MLRIILFGLAIFSAIDYAATTRAIAHGIAEGNPAMVGIVGTVWFPLLKLVIIPGALYLIWLSRHRWTCPAIIWLFLLPTFGAYVWVTQLHARWQVLL